MINYWLLHLSQTKDVQYCFTGVDRHVGKFWWGKYLEGRGCHIWVTFRSADEKQMSNLYLGEV